MKFVVVFLLCLFAGTLAHPPKSSSLTLSSPALSPSTAIAALSSLLKDNIVKRSAESSSENESTATGAVMTTILNRALDAVRQIAKESGVALPKDVAQIVQRVMNGDLTLDQVDKILSAGNIKRIIKQANPMNDIMESTPLVNDLYEAILGMIASPLALIASALITAAQVVGTITSSLTNIPPLA